MVIEENSLPVKLLLGCFMMLLVSGCATLNKDECLYSDWRLIGFEDGSAGQPGSRIGEHRKACARHGIKPDVQAYQAGRKEGLEAYCQEIKGYNIGLSGRRYQGVCPRALEDRFLAGYDLGRAIYIATAKVYDLQTGIRASENRLVENKKALEEAEAKLVSYGLSRTERVEILADIKSLAKEQEKLENDISQLNRELALAEDDLQKLKENDRYGG